MRTTLLILHVAGGSLALVSALVASLAQAAKASHAVHVWAGRVFVISMAMVVISSVPLAVLVQSPFLVLIGVFSGYLTATGWRFAKNRSGRLTAVDWAIPGLMVVAAVAMVGYGALNWADQGVVLVVFGVGGLILAGRHLRSLRRSPVRGRSRISSHLVGMLAAAIAATTAFLVVNGPLGVWDWFLPTIVLTPVIILWSRRVRAGGRTTLTGSRDA